MPTNKQRREAAQRHLQRQLARRAELSRKRRRNVLVVVTVFAMFAVAGGVALVSGLAGGDGGTDPSAAPTTSASVPTTAAAPTTNADGTFSCTYTPDTSGNPNIVDAGTPPSPEATPTQGTVSLLMSTNQGDIPLTLDRAKAPCATASFAYLAQQKFFDGSPCHRMVNQPTFGVLQCGDPTGTGQGGPAYKFAEEVGPDTAYPRGTIAMANSGAPGSTGSQFFLVFADAQLPPAYTVVGTVDEAGLAVLDEIAAAGNDGSFEPSPGGGAPNTPVTIETMTVAG